MLFDNFKNNVFHITTGLMTACILTACGTPPNGGSSSTSSAVSSTSSSSSSSSSSSGSVVHPSCPSSKQTAYQGNPAMVPGFIQAENYDPSGYSDSTTGNEGGEYRNGDDVDVKSITNGYAVGWMMSGEWLEYTVYVAQAGNYDITIRSASASGGDRTLSVEQCGETLVNNFNVPEVANWGDFKTWSAGSVHLEPGYQKLRILVGSQDYMDLDWIHVGPYEGSLDPVGSSKDTLYVQLDQVIKPVTHVASGALYGVVEHIPANIQDLVAPLSPSSYVQPALAGNGRQQPYGGALAVAARLEGVTNAKVTVRLADVLPGWPYRWSGWSSWESTVRTVIRDKRASGRNNYYGYEIWNEPYGTWKNENGDFFSALWKPTYDLLRSLDSQERIIGPSLSYFSQSRMRDFLTYCKANNCLPDIISWHQWGSETLSANVDAYRAMEQSMGISPRLLAINEYSHNTHDLEGAPGPSAPFIAKFERKGVDTANISWWFPALPGRLGSLITAQNQRNGGWWFYKWYGDMTGNMVKTIPPNDNSDGLDGFANLDLSNQWASVALGGNHKGMAYVTLSGIPASFGTTVEVKVEHVVWSSKETPVNGTVLDATKTYSVVNGSITVPVNMTDPLWGYRVYLTP